MSSSRHPNGLAESEPKPTRLKGYRITTVCCNYGQCNSDGLWLESQEWKRSNLKQLEKTLANATRQWKARLKQLCAQEFTCEADAIAALKKFAKNRTWHHLETMDVKQKLHYEKPSKPKQGTELSRITYQPQASFKLNPTVVAQQQRRAGRCILTTNVVEAAQLSEHQSLEEYKGQQSNECGFRFLKEPMLFADSVFLKSPERIMVLGLIMGLCLLVYNLGSRQLRQALKQSNQTLPNQLGKETPSLT